MAPRARVRDGSGMISDSSYSRVAPNPLQAEQAPRGLLNEKSAGVTVAAGVSQRLQAENSVKRSLPASCSARATPSPSPKDAARDSASRDGASGPAVKRSTTTSSSLLWVRSSFGGSSS